MTRAKKILAQVVDAFERRRTGFPLGYETETAIIEAARAALSAPPESAPAPDAGLDRDCDTCLHANKMPSEEPCAACQADCAKFLGFTRWEPMIWHGGTGRAPGRESK